MEQDEYPDEHAQYQRSNLSTRQHESEFYEDDRDVDQDGMDSSQAQPPQTLTAEEEQELNQTVQEQEMQVESSSEMKEEPAFDEVKQESLDA